MADDRTALAAGGEGRNTPAAAHVASLALAGRASVASSLHRAARLAGRGERTRRRAGVSLAPAPADDARRARCRAALADRYAVATANASVNAIRGALRAAWLSGDMDRAMLERSLAALRQVRGNAAPGRALSPVEARKLFEAAAGDRNRAAGARDAALLALAYGAGLRRAELAAARLADLDGDTLGVHGKGRRERFAYLGANGCAAAVSAWIAVRGTEDGPLFRPVNKGGRVIAGGMSPRAIGKRVQVLGTRSRAREGVAAHAPAQLRHVAALRRERSLRYRRPDGPRPDGHHPALRPPGRVREARRRVHDFGSLRPPRGRSACL